MAIIVTTDEDLKRLISEALEDFVAMNGGVFNNNTPKKANSKKEEKEEPNYELMPLLNRKEAATFLGISAKTMQRLKISGKVPFVNIGGERYQMKDLIEFKKKQLRSFNKTTKFI